MTDINALEPNQHGQPLPEGVAQHAPVFPEVPVAGGVYFTEPSLVVFKGTPGDTTLGTSAIHYDLLPQNEQRDAQARRADRYIGIGNAASRHIAHQEEIIEEAQALANTDALTGLRNRRGFMQNLVETVAAVQGKEDQLPSLLFLDLDNFKELNDTKGHAAGDELLRKVGTKFQEIFRLRKGDVIGRTGGDEFVAIVHADTFENLRRHPQGEDKVAAGLAARIERTVHDIAVDMKSNVRVSIQPVKYTPGESAAEWLERADKAMYEIKRARKAERALEAAKLKESEPREVASRIGGFVRRLAHRE